uniref:Uncharacterized protein n=1 Tax=Arundo donax TaxID=35708 RepID=A0A0A9GVH0_ARUDO
MRKEELCNSSHTEHQILVFIQPTEHNYTFGMDQIFWWHGIACTDGTYPGLESLGGMLPTFISNKGKITLCCCSCSTAYDFLATGMCNSYVQLNKTPI